MCLLEGCVRTVSSTDEISHFCCYACCQSHLELSHISFFVCRSSTGPVCPVPAWCSEVRLPAMTPALLELPLRPAARL